MKRRAVLLLALLTLGGVAGGVVHERGQATTRAELLREIDVRITDRGIVTDTGLARSELIRGSVAEFRVVNASSKPRNFAVGIDRTPVLAPGERDRIHVDLAVRGPLPYRVTVNCAPGLSGVFQVS